MSRSRVRSGISRSDDGAGRRLVNKVRQSRPKRRERRAQGKNNFGYINVQRIYRVLEGTLFFVNRRRKGTAFFICAGYVVWRLLRRPSAWQVFYQGQHTVVRIVLSLRWRVFNLGQ